MVHAKLHQVDPAAKALHVAEVRLERLLGEDETNLGARAQKSLL
jgi:hypothetical protein